MLQSDFKIQSIKLGRMEITAESRRSMRYIEDGFHAFLNRVGMPLQIISAPSMRDLIKLYYSEVPEEGELSQGVDEDGLDF